MVQKDLKDLIKQNQVDDEIEEDNGIKKIIAVIVILLLVVGGGGFGYYKYSQGQKAEQSKLEKQRKEKQKFAQKQQQSEEEDIYEDDSKVAPQMEWVKKPYSSSFTKSKNNVAQAQDWSFKQKFGEAVDGIPSEKNGFTSDPKESPERTKKMNMKYVPFTKEDALYYFGIYSQRLLNPIFGGWAGAQYSEKDTTDAEIKAANYETMRDMFTDAWWAANVVNEHNFNQKAFPIYADWGNDNYGGFKFNEKLTYRWMGRVDNMTTRLVLSKDKTYYDITSNMNVIFATETADGTVAERKGVLTMTLTPNRDDRDKDKENKLLISSAKLTVNG